MSQGMLLAAEDSNTVSLLVPTEKIEGTRILANNVESKPNGLISHKEFSKIKFEIAKIEGVDGEKVILKGKKEYVLKNESLKNYIGFQSVLVHEKANVLVLHTKKGIITLDRPVASDARVK
jgi:hypothetical protein